MSLEQIEIDLRDVRQMMYAEEDESKLNLLRVTHSWLRKQKERLTAVTVSA